MRALQQLVAPSPTPSQSPTSGTSGSAYGPYWNTSTFSVQDTAIYVGVSIGILLVGLLLISLLIWFWLRPRQRHLQAQRRRDTGLQGVKTDEDQFVPKIRPFPVIVIHPGSGEIAITASEEWQVFDASQKKLAPSKPATLSTASRDELSNLDTVHLSEASSSACAAETSEGLPPQQALSSFPPRDSAASIHLLEGGVVSPQQENTRGSPVEENMIFNPLTHFVTDRHPQLFIADLR